MIHDCQTKRGEREEEEEEEEKRKHSFVGLSPASVLFSFNNSYFVNFRVHACCRYNLSFWGVIVVLDDAIILDQML
jgi:hypothetical protein